MEAIIPEKAIKLSKKLNKFSYFANPFYLLGCTFEKVNGEEIVFERDVVDNKIKPLFLPGKQENI